MVFMVCGSSCESEAIEDVFCAIMKQVKPGFTTTSRSQSIPGP